MTDNEIIKALLTVAYGGHSCNKCKHKLDKGEVRCGLMGCKITREAHDLINRQKAEIERLQERYKRASDNLKAVLDERADHTEAIKEFAERLKKKSQPTIFCDNSIQKTRNVYYRIEETDIDNLVKEMVGDDK